jgi:hypothetical protein
MIGGNMTFTHHAAMRMRQRGVPEEILDLVLQFGRERPRPGRACEISMTRCDAANLVGILKRMIHMIEKAQRKKAVISRTDGAVITVYSR